MERVGAFCIPADHPSLPGHFPGRPIVPGVVLLDAAFALILARHPGYAPAALPAIRFTKPVRPGQPVDVACDGGVFCDGGPGRIAFACAVDGQTVLHGSVVLAGPRE